MLWGTTPVIRVNYTYLNSGGHPLYIHMHAAVTDADDEMIVVVSVVLLAKFFCASEYGRGCRSEGIRCFNSSHPSRQGVLLFRRNRSIAP